VTEAKSGNADVSLSFTAISLTISFGFKPGLIFSVRASTSFLDLL